VHGTSPFTHPHCINKKSRAIQKEDNSSFR